MQPQRLAAGAPVRVGGGVSNVDRPRQVDARRTGAVADVDDLSIEQRDQVGRHPRRQQRFELQPARCQHADRRDAAGRHRLDVAADLVQRFGQRRVRRDLLEHRALGRRDTLIALPGADVRDRAAHQLARSAGQAREAQLAGPLRALRRQHLPLEQLRRAIERERDVIAQHGHRIATRALQGHRKVRHRPAQQLRPRQAEQRLGIAVQVEQLRRVGIEDDDDFRGVIDQGSIARLAVAQRLFHRKAARHVAHRDDPRHAPTVRNAAGRDLRGECEPVARMGGHLAVPGLVRLVGP